MKTPSGRSRLGRVGDACTPGSWELAALKTQDSGGLRVEGKSRQKLVLRVLPAFNLSAFTILCFFSLFLFLPK